MLTDHVGVILAHSSRFAFLKSVRPDTFSEEKLLDIVPNDFFNAHFMSRKQLEIETIDS